MPENDLPESHERLRPLLDAISDMAFVLRHADDGQFYIVDANTPAIALTGLGRESIVGRPLSRVAPNWEHDAEKLVAAVESGVPVVTHALLRLPAGEAHLETTLSPIVISDERFLYGISRDVSATKLALRAIEDRESALHAAQRAAKVGSWTWQPRGRGVSWSSEMYRILGYGHDVEPSWQAFIDRVHPADVDRVSEAFMSVVSRAVDNVDEEHRIVHPDGRELYVCSSVTSDDKDGEDIRVVGAVHDISDRRKAEEELERRAFHDPLTGLANRALLSDRLSHAIARLGRNDRQLVVLFVDLDRFKVVNDCLGHQAGDALIVEVANRIRSTLRPEDTVARIGGDEFVVLCEDVAMSDDEVGVIPLRIFGEFMKPVVFAGQTIYPAASIGVTVCSDPDATVEGLLHEADAAMYLAKSLGGDSHRFFSHTELVSNEDRLSIENDMRHALAADEFRMVYQPIVSLDQGAVVGLESLLRWEHPTRGLMRPDDFLPIAEETGLIHQVGRWVVEQVCRQIAEWRDRFGSAPLVSVNLSPRQVTRPGLADHLERCVRKYAIDPKALCIEITEHGLFTDQKAAQRTVNELVRLGTRIALDDFGTGHSSLQHLRWFRPDVIKVDKQFMPTLTDPNGTDKVIVEMVAALSDTLDGYTVAEGVENEEQCRIVQELGIDLVQGFYFSGPVPADEAARLFSGEGRIIRIPA